MKVEDFTPKLTPDGRYVLMLIESSRCPICSCVMVQKADRGIFPLYMHTNQEAQMSKANIEFISKAKVDDEYVCKKCSDDGKVDFLCAVCEERKPTSKIKESIGDPPEHMCTDCYRTVTAEKWRQIRDRLHDEHKYDHI